jgi:translocation and assembly module TamB
MRKALKITLFVLGGIIVLLATGVIWLNTNSGKSFVRGRIVAFLEKKIKTEVQIGELGYGLPKYVDLKNVLFKDQNKDTLLVVGHLRVNLSMMKLLSNTVEVQEITLEGVHSHIYRNAPDTSYNFSYIIDAFTGNKKQAEAKAKDTSGTDLVIDIDKLVLNDIHARFDDYTGGTRFAINLDHLQLNMNKTDLQAMDFQIKDLAVNGLRGSFTQDTSYLPEEPDTSTQKAQFKLIADEIDLQNVDFVYGDNLTKFLMDIKLGRLQTEARLFDLAKEKADVEELSLQNSTIKIVMGKNSPVPEIVDSLADTLAKSNWRITANKLALDNVNFIMDDENKTRQSFGMDYAHLNAKNLALQAENILYTADSIMGNIQHMAGQEKSGFDLKELKTEFAYHMNGGYLRNLYLQTSNTILQDFAEVKYPSLDALKTNPALMEFNLKLTKSVVGLRDVLIFVPQLRQQEFFRKFGNRQLQLEANMNGYVNAININNLYLAGLNNTKIHLTGKLNGLPETRRLNYNLNILQLQSTNADISSLLPRQALEQVRIPNNFLARGQVSGTMLDYRTNLAIMSSDGAAVLKGYVYMSPGKGNERYDMAVNTTNLNLGRILKKDSLLGTVTARVAAKGRSFDIKRMEAMVNGDIERFGFMGYNYSSIRFDGELTKQQGNLQLVSNDPNAKLQLDAEADLTNEYPKLNARLNIDSADLQALKFYKDEMRIRALILADIDKMDKDYPSGIVVIDKPTITAKGQRYFLDTLKITSRPNADSGQYIVIAADALDGLITGKTPLSQIGNIITEHINRHYMITSDSAKKKNVAAAPVNKNIPADYNLDIRAVVRDRPLLYALIPSLKSMDTIRINAGLTPRTMFLDVDAPRIVIDGVSIDSGKVRVNENDSALTYVASVNQVSHPDFRFWFSKAEGTVKGNAITANVTIADSVKKNRFALNAVYHQHHDKQEIHLNDGLKLNYKDWQVAQPNAIVIGKEGIYVQNFKITNGGESISINSDAPQFSAPMTVAINNFLISNITEIVQKDTLLANGVLNSNIKVKNITTAPAADGTLQILNLSVKNDTIGDLNVTLQEASANRANANIAITGRGNDIIIAGSYYPIPVNGNNFDLTVNVNALNLKTMEGLAMNQIKNSSGLIRGTLQIKGTTAAPIVTGELRTDNLSTTPVALGAPFLMPQEKIRFVEDGIVFENFRLVDSFGNAAAVNGKITTRDLKNVELALRIRANKWQALNNTEKENELFYGKLVLSTNMRVTGTVNAPIVDGNLTIHDTTKLTVVVPKNDPQVVEREGIVEFVDMDDPNRYNLLAPKDTTPKIAMRTGTDLNLNVGVEKNAEVNIIIDQATGDFLRVRGEANLNTTVSPDGTIGLTGTYDLQQGSYQLNYNFIKRRFDIQPGSTIIFAGDPMEAEVNITATYTANVPPYDLVARQVDDVALNFYKQRLPFDVQLKLKGPLLEPEISFDIVLPEERNYRVNTDVITTVQGKLNELRNNPSELNKQVFAVLILNRFVGENPFESGTGTDAEYIARQSASRFLSEQLNKMANNLFNGFELNLDLEATEDYTTGQKRNRTDLNVSASKRLLDDRLTITVGNNFELEGQTQNTNQTTSLVPGNLAADYKLSPDGRYAVRIYRKNEIENIMEGYAVETGVNFIINLEYNRFRNLFIRRNRNNNTNNNRGGNQRPTGTSN